MQKDKVSYNVNDNKAFYEAIVNWKLCAEQAESAENDRDYDAFQYVYRRAKREFAVIKNSLAKGLQDTMPQKIRAELIETTTIWNRLTEKLEDWKIDLAAEAESIKKRSKKEAKLNKKYGTHLSKVGANLRLHAR